MPLNERHVTPSILSADFSRLSSHVREIMDEGCRVIHCDVMDGHFVPPITFGPMVVSALRPGGTLVYSTCTLSPRENERQAEAAGLRLESARLVLPHRDRTDGFYIARMTA